MVQTTPYLYVIRGEDILHGTDFETLVQAYFEPWQIHYGAIFVVRRSPQDITQRLLVILDQVTSGEMENQVRYI